MTNKGLTATISYMSDPTIIRNINIVLYNTNDHEIKINTN